MVGIDHHTYGAMTNLGHNPAFNTSEVIFRNIYCEYNELCMEEVKVQLLEAS